MSRRSQAPGSVLALVPAWNGEAFIERTLESLAAQSHADFRVLISDDASTDGTAAVCQRFVDRDRRFSLIRQPRNLGWVGNTNALLAQAEGDNLLFAFHDDVLRPSYVARCVAALEANPAAIVAFSDLLTFYQQGETELRQYTELDGVASRFARARLVLERRGDWSTPNRGVFRASAARKIGGLKRHLAGEFSADWPWLLHMALLGEFVRVPEVLVEKYYTEGSLSRGWNFSPRHQLGALLSCAREIHGSDASVVEAIRLYGYIARRGLGALRRISVREVRVRG